MRVTRPPSEHFFFKPMNRSKLYEWLLDNECPFEWNVDEQSSDLKQVVLIFEEND